MKVKLESRLWLLSDFIELGGHTYRVLSVSDDGLTLTVEPYGT